MAAAKQQPAQPKTRAKAGQKSQDQMPRSIVQQEVTPGYTSTGIDTTAQQYNPTSYQPGTGWAPTVGGANGRPVPNIAQENPDKPNLTILGAAGTSFFGGLIQNTGEYNPTLHWRDWVTKVDEMLRSDAQLRALQELLTNTLLAAKWSIVPANDDPVNVEIASFVETCLLKDIRYTTDAGIEVRQDFKQILRHILLMVPYGFSPLEVAWRQEDDGEGGYWLKLAKLQPLLPSTVYRWWVGRDVELEGIQTWAWKDYAWRFTNIPASKLLLFTHDMQGQNYEGLSALRPAFQAWYYKQQFLKIAAIAVERNGVEIPVINLGANATSADANAALRLGQNMRANSQPAAVLPNDWKIEYPRLSQNHAATILPWVQYFDVLMGRAYHAPWVNLGSTEVGAYNLDASQKRMTLMAWQAIPDTEICPVLQPLIEQIVRLNFGEQDLYPRLECGKLIATDVTVLADSLQALGMYLQPGPEINDWVADAMGVPKPAQNAVEATNPSGPDDGGNDSGASGEDGDSGNDGTQDEGDSSSDGGDGGGSAAMAESARLLAEALAAIQGVDAVERGAVWLGGHLPGYSQNRDRGGRFAPGDGGEGRASGSGASRGRGRGRGAGEGEQATGRGRGGGGGSGSGGSGRARAAKGAKGEKQLSARTLRSRAAEAEQHQHETEARRRQAEVQLARAHEAHNAATEADRAAQAESARLAGKRGFGAKAAHEAAYAAARATYAARGEAGGRLIAAQQMHDNAVRAHEAATERATAARAAADEATAREARSGGGKRGGGAKAGEGEKAARTPKAATAKQPTETIHERAARLQREAGLPREVQPGEKLTVQHYLDVRNINPNITGRAMVEESRAAYGEHQLGAALRDQSMENLRNAARDYGLKPGGTKADLLSRITAHVTEGRYSANFGGSSAAGGKRAAGEGAKGSGGARASARGEAKAKLGKITYEQYKARIAELKGPEGSLRGDNEHAAILGLRASYPRFAAREARESGTARTFDKNGNPVEAKPATAKATRGAGARAEQPIEPKVEANSRFTAEERANGKGITSKIPELEKLGIDPLHTSARIIRVVYGETHMAEHLRGASHEALRDEAKALGAPSGKSKADTVRNITSHLLHNESFDESFRRLEAAARHAPYNANTQLSHALVSARVGSEIPS